MIIAKNIHKSYIKKEKEKLFFSRKKSIKAVNNLNIIIEEGKIIGLLGINGAGKSTTIKLLSTLLKPDSGTITLDGKDIYMNKYEIKPMINMIVGEERAMYWRLSAKENLEYFGKLYGLKKRDLDQRIKELINFVGLDGRENEPIEGFSKGMKQRVQIARGLINDPKYIFLDEPTLGLDVSSAKKIREYIKELSENGKGILLTSHYLSEIEELCDYVYIMNKGQIILEGTTEYIIQKMSVNKYKYYFEVKLKKDITIGDVLENLREKERYCVKEIVKISENYSVVLESKERIDDVIFNEITQMCSIKSYDQQLINLEEVMIKIIEENDVK